MDRPSLMGREALHLRVTGQVQGVGFRPWVYHLASSLGLAGWVRNDGQGVEAHLEGEEESLSRFLARLAVEAPSLARVDAVHTRPAAPEGYQGFTIEHSAGGPVATGIPPDTGLCSNCLAELFDPADRRHRHAFITCTQCGPRYTLTRALPYDRPNTSMGVFPMCPDCAREYADPANRRFHAEPVACPACGPRLAWLDAAGEPLPVDDPIAASLALLRAGGIVAIKGLGGFHLACDARNGAAVAALRERKQREEKPFAVMGAGIASLRRVARLGRDEESLLAAPQRPIVLADKAPGCDAALPGVAPGLARVGLMLPATPVQYLLFHEAAGRPAGSAWLGEEQPLLLVMTSANPHGEPLVVGNEEALMRLDGIADAYLVHDRDILVRCDDSVAHAAPGGAPAFVRRARGWTPAPIRLEAPGPSILALGGMLKNTVCVTRGDEAFLSQHLGDLDNRSACLALEEAVDHLLAVLEVEPELVACDLHPDFHSTRHAAAIARDRGLPLVEVQHHHAHGAAVLAEHRHGAPALALTLDGVGLGSDGAAWGGELLRLDGGAFRRLGHLYPLKLPGGDRAAREPWRMAAAALHALGRDGEIHHRWPGPGGKALGYMLGRDIGSPPTSSAGRLFDAAAGLLGLRDETSFEGQAAMELEGLAESTWPVAPMPGGYNRSAAGNLDFLPLLARLADGCPAAEGAALFHATLVAGLADWVEDAAGREGLSTVALGGGCFLNRILSRELARELAARGLTVLEARLAPPNDGGISLGQAEVARRRALSS